MNYVNVFINELIGTSNWVWNQIIWSNSIPWYQNYFYGLIFISLFVWGLELLFPWRKNQSLIRKDFWLDTFYMFFNFFIFSIVIGGFYALIQKITSNFGFTMSSLTIIDINKTPFWASLLLFFILNDFVQWFTHVLLHRYDFLWRFHQVHHSVKEMGFAAHLRYHWMENILYKPLKTLAIMILGGFEPEMAFAVHFFAITIGHLNHANVRITWGPLKYIFNNSVMHLYHHAKHLPENKRYGVNFGISLSIWDYVFGSNYIPQSKDGSYELGWQGDENYPKHSFFKQLFSGFKN